MEFIIANSSHDKQLRALNAEISMPGSVQIAYGREPSFFFSKFVEGKQTQVIAAVNAGKVVGMGARSIRPMFINGEEKLFGYLSSLRARAAARNRFGLARGYHFLKQLHEDCAVPAYISTIVDKNKLAKKILTSRRAGLPLYHDLGSYITYAVPLSSRKTNRNVSHDLVIKRGVDVSIDRIVGFLRSEGSQKQFFPVYDREDFLSTYTRGFQPADFYIAFQGTEIIGVLGAWDQNDFKQYIITGFNSTFKLTRRLMNVFLKLASYQTIPTAGSTLKAISLSFLCTKDNNPKILSALVDTFLHSVRTSGYHFFMAGFHESDPLRQAFRKLPAMRYASRLYFVCWDDGLDCLNRLERDRVPYLDVATL